MTDLLLWTDLTLTQFWLLLAITTMAGIVRGFSGFALSAIVMASAATFIPPVQLIPICFWLEFCASLLMIRGGWQDADKRVVFGLVAGSIIGTPIGLALTVSLPVETSKLVVLIIVIVLAVLLLAKVRMAFLATKPGLYLSGLAAGIVGGLAAVAGMVVALYVLSQASAARQMRGSLVLFLCVTLVTSFFYLIYFDVMTMTAVKRAAIFAAPTFAGVIIGQRMFTLRFEPYYRPFCLTLLTGLAVAGLIRTSLT
jgi:uncharacterized membrane protein YfcA